MHAVRPSPPLSHSRFENDHWIIDRSCLVAPRLGQDSLGGNAKTLMFVNFSPADYNRDETLTSLLYASRVKLITNDASKSVDNEEISRLKNVIKDLKAGGNGGEVGG